MRIARLTEALGFGIVTNVSLKMFMEGSFGNEKPLAKETNVALGRGSRVSVRHPVQVRNRGWYHL